ncbi:hypothetical protein CSB94_2704 [Pseudomonas aeruginosa]|nr:hypothetical protein CSB94_2704 [Pseudomonas aeruginosa]
MTRHFAGSFFACDSAGDDRSSAGDGMNENRLDLIMRIFIITPTGREASR